MAARSQPLRALLLTQWWIVVAPVASYAAAVLWGWHFRSGAWGSAWAGARAFVALLGLSALTTIAAGVPWPRETLLAAAGAGFLLVVLVAAVRQPWRIATALLSAAVLGVTFLQLRAPVRAPPLVERRILHTRYQSLEVRVHQNYLPSGPTTGGGIATVGGRVFVVTGDGQLSEVRFGADDQAVVTRLPFQVPVNGEFAARAARTGGVNAFRTTGLLVRAEGDDLQFFAMHHYWHEAGGCFTMRISTTTRPAADVARAEPATWRTLFETRPCLKPRAPFPRGFTVFESGGRLVAQDDDHLLVTVGDHEFDGVNSTPAQAQDPASDYGKVLLVHRVTGARSIFSLGHRNPQGLHRDADGALWIAEHGPDGGDEVNQLKAGANYGWPVVTYGTDYGENVWPSNPNPGEHLGFTVPLFTWVPAIGVSALTRIQGNAFAGWTGDMLAGSLRDASLHRLRIRDDRTMFDERIPIGRRIRDVQQVAADRILLVTDDRAIVSVRPFRAGQRETEAFAACAVCHPIGDGRSHGIGPDLFGVYRRAVGSAPGFDFSPAMKRLNFRWNREQLDRFVANPSAVAPGTTMDVDGVADPAQRELIVNHLIDAR